LASNALQVKSGRMSDDKIGRLSDDSSRWFQEDGHAELVSASSKQSASSLVLST